MSPKMSKATLLCVKYLPFLYAILDIVAIVLSYLEVPITCLGCIVSASLLSVIPLYILSYTFRFCKYHRTIIDFLVFTKVCFLIDYVYIIPFSDSIFLTIYLMMAFFFLIKSGIERKRYGDRH